MKYPAITNESMISQDQLESLIMSTVLTNAEISYVRSIFELTSMDFNKEISFVYSLDDKVKTESGARRRLDSLFKKGVLGKRFKKTGKAQRPFTIYFFTLDNVTKKNDLIANQNLKPVTKDISSKLLTPFNNTEMEIDFLINLIMPSVSLVELNERLSFDLTWDNSKINISSYKTNDPKIEHVCITRDIQCYLSLIRLANQKETKATLNNESTTNQFYINIEDLRETLNQKLTKDDIIESIERLSSTQYRVSNLPAILIKRFKLTKGVQYINLISSVGFYEINDETSGYLSTGLLFSIPDFIYRGIKYNNNISESYNPRIIKDENPIMFLFHMYCRKNLSDKAGRIYKTTIQDIKNSISPSSENRDFKSLFFKGLEREHLIKLENGQKVDSSDNSKLMPTTYSNGEIIEFRCDVFGYLVSIKGQHVNIICNLSDKYIEKTIKKGAKKKRRGLIKPPQLNLDL